METIQEMYEKARASGSRCLIVESDIELRRILEKMLRELGFEVFGTDNGRHAVIMQALEPFDIMILHWNNKIIHGEGILKAMSIICEKKPKVIIMTGATQVSFSFDLPIAGFLYKPFSSERVINCVREAMEST